MTDQESTVEKTSAEKAADLGRRSAPAFQSSAFASLAQTIEGTTYKDSDSFGAHTIAKVPAKADQEQKT